MTTFLPVVLYNFMDIITQQDFSTNNFQRDLCASKPNFIHVIYVPTYYITRVEYDHSRLLRY